MRRRLLAPRGGGAVEDYVETRRPAHAARRWSRKPSHAGRPRRGEVEKAQQRMTTRAAVPPRLVGAPSCLFGVISSESTTLYEVAGRGHVRLARRVCVLASSLVTVHDGR
jgi:uncharacterized protein YbjT (DUF2867 family)